LAAQLAAQLGWRWVGRELVNQAALAAGVPQVALDEVDELGLLGIRPSVSEWRAYRTHVERIIRELADAGAAVIVGRGGQMVLRTHPAVLHVRVVAPFATRLAWLRQETGLAEEAATAGKVAEAFTPDFYLPEQDLTIELTTMEQHTITRKHRKMRRLRELYPEINSKLLNRRSFRQMMLKYGLAGDDAPIGPGLDQVRGQS